MSACWRSRCSSCKDGAGHAVLVNEIAPRVHNSGHWTIDGASVSQFEQHIRAVAGLPLGKPVRRGRIEMTNLLGDEVERCRPLARNARRRGASLRQDRRAAGPQDGARDAGVRRIGRALRLRLVEACRELRMAKRVVADRRSGGRTGPDAGGCGPCGFFWDDWRSGRSCRSEPAAAAMTITRLGGLSPSVLLMPPGPAWDSSAPSGVHLPVPNSRPDPITR